MQTSLLPAYICDAIDRKICDLIWGSVEGARKIHNINWDTVCKPKSSGGLGLQNARDLNKAFLMKIAWGVFDRPTDLWARVLISKYLKNTHNDYVLARKSGFSTIWRGVLKVWPHVLNGIHWSVRDGRSTHFWTDRWVDRGITLADHALNIRKVDRSLLVSHVCSEPGVWNFDFLSKILPRDIVMQVVGMYPPADRLGKDSLVWGLEANGVFSVRTTYLMITESLSYPVDPIWSCIWKWNGPSKIRHFLWQATHKSLLTNEERGRGHLTNQVLCPRCSSHIEYILHVLYECDFALQVWRDVLPAAIGVRAALGDFNSWWRHMLRDVTSSIKFGITTWVHWSARNKFIFENQNQPVTTVVEHCKFWINLVLSSWKTNQLGREAPGLAR
ncbi:Putative ribonuclease H protein At1g65750 [Linum perenne]